MIGTTLQVHVGQVLVYERRTRWWGITYWTEGTGWRYTLSHKKAVKVYKELMAALQAKWDSEKEAAA